MDQQLHDSSSFERAFAVAQQRHKETVSELHRLREELRERDVVIKRLQANLGDRFDAELERRLLKDQLKKLQEGMQKAVGEDDMKVDEGAVTSSDSSASTAAVQDLAMKGKNWVAKMPLEYLADILGYLDRFSLDRVEFTCPKLRAAVSTLDGQNLRSLDSLRLDATGSGWDAWGGPASSRARGGGDRGRGGQTRPSLSDVCQSYLADPADITFTIVVDYHSDPMTLKNGATGTTVKLTWHVFGMPEQVTPQASSHFVGLIRNASVQQVSLTGPLSHHLIQELSAADVDVAVGSLEVRSFTPEAANLAVGRGSLVSFNRLEKLAIYDAPLGLLSDDLLLAATQKRVMSLTLKSHRFQLGDGRGWGGGGWNANGPTRRHVQAATTAEVDCPELCDGVLAFLFRDDLDENAKVELRFPGACVPQDFCQSIMDRAISAGTRYSIDASFVAVSNIDEDLVGFQEYRRLDNHDPNYVVYNVPDPNVDDAVVELKIITVERDEWDANAPPLVWKLVEFRRCRKTDASRFSL